MKDIEFLCDQLCGLVSKLKTVEEKADALNFVRGKLHEISPFKDHPVDFVFWEKSESVEGNDYNPNSVAPPEMKLLIKSISEDGYTMPIVSYRDEENIKIVDGFHRRKSERISTEISRSTHGYIPLTNIRNSQADRANRIASTIRHNQARGTHSIPIMNDIVAELVKIGMGDAWIMKHIGMDADTLLRHKQLSGLTELFRGKEFTNAENETY